MACSCRPKTPPDVIRKFHADTITALADPVVKEKLAQAGYTVVGSRPEELRELLKSEIEKWAAVIKAAGIPERISEPIPRKSPGSGCRVLRHW
jgi:tripartite-type tricarboxylate transporter receptor subunit TctC